MNSIFDSPLATGAMLGALGTALLLTWKAGASRWSTWFPLIRRICEWGLIGLAIAWALLSVSMLLKHTENVQSVGAGALVGLLGFPVLRYLRRRRPEEKIERGAAIATAQEVARMVKKMKGSSELSLGEVPFLRDNEPYHFMIAGATGSGKSVAIRSIADVLRKRGDTVIMVDSGGEFINRYFNAETDHVINPFDSRCVAWSPLAEMDGPWDAQSLARSIVPDGHGDNKEWNGYAQTLVTSVLQKMAEVNDRRLGRFLYLLQQASIPELQAFLQGTPALAQLSSEKTFGSIRTIASNYLLPYGYLDDSDKPFSVSKFVREHKPGFLFLSYRDDQLDSLRNLISAVLDVASRTLLALQPDGKRRVWLIIDEFASIGKVQSIEAVATKARKNGGCLLLGLQSVSQIRDRYGEHAAQSILSCLSTWLVLRCTDAETAEYMSKYIGEATVVRLNKSESSNVSGDSDSASEQRTTERVVLASEVQALPNLNGFLKTPGGLPVCKVKLSFPPKVAGEVAFEQRDFARKPMMDVGKYKPAKAATPTPVAAAPKAAVQPAKAPAAAAPASRADVRKVTQVPRPPATGARPPAVGKPGAGHFYKAPTAPTPAAPLAGAPTPNFKSSRLNELLERRNAARAGLPVKVSASVAEAATRVAMALAERVHAAAQAQAAAAAKASPTPPAPGPSAPTAAPRPARTAPPPASVASPVQRAVAAAPRQAPASSPTAGTPSAVERLRQAVANVPSAAEVKPAPALRPGVRQGAERLQQDRTKKTVEPAAPVRTPAPAPVPVASPAPAEVPAPAPVEPPATVADDSSERELSPPSKVEPPKSPAARPAAEPAQAANTPRRRRRGPGARMADPGREM